MIIDLFAGPGGWDLGAEAAGLPTPVGIEWDADACRTRVAAGLPTIRADVAAYRIPPGITGLIASPPCTAFSMAGKGAGRSVLDQLVAAMTAGDWYWGRDEHPATVWLPLEAGRWAVESGAEWIAMEQVPPALVLWKALARLLERRGYSTWCGVLNAADYGVPQTRRRAILMANRTRTVQPPVATHAEDPVPSLFGDEQRPWVSMAEALGWGFAEDPAVTVTTGGAGSGGSDAMLAGGAGGRAAQEGRGRQWVVGFPRQADGQPSIELDGEEYRERDLFPDDGPAPTVTEKARSWQRWAVQTGQQTQLGGGETELYERPVDEPAPTVAFGHDAANWEADDQASWVEHHPERVAAEVPTAWTEERPATTVVASFRPDIVTSPGHRSRGPDGHPRQSAPGSVRITVAEAAVLQSFPADYPFYGSKTSRFLQVGNAVPVRLAGHVLAAASGVPWPPGI